MPKVPTFPTLYDEVLQISITNLKKWGYLDKNQSKSGQLTWSRKGEEIGSIGITSNMQDENSYVMLNYTYNKTENRNYNIDLVTIPSNLGKGKIWYFQCPQTFQLCRKLYSIGGWFLHREAFNGVYYESQTHSKYYRYLDKTLGAYFRSDQIYEQLHKKYFKTHYAGKPTKRYQKLIKQIEQAESIPYEKIEMLMIKR